MKFHILWIHAPVFVLMLFTFYEISLFLECFYILYCICRKDLFIIFVNVDQMVSVISHVHFLHVAELTKAMTGLDPFYQIWCGIKKVDILFSRIS